MTRDDLVELSKHRNVAAFLRVIRQAESNQTEHAYRIRWGGGMITGDLSAHPGDTTEATDRNGRVIRSSAAGCYQFLASTWRDVAGAYGITDFGPESQDAAAVALIRRASALDDVLAGRFEPAVRKCAPVWAGLPGDVYGQGGISMADARRVYEQYGGQYAPAEPAPATAVEPASPPPIAPAYDEFGSPESPPRPPSEAAGVQPSPRPADASGGLLERPAMSPVILATLATELLGLVPWFAGKSETAQRNVAALQRVAPVLIEAAKSASGQSGAAEAVDALKTDQAAAAKFVQAVAPKWSEIEPALRFEEESRGEARAFADRMTSTGPFWRQLGYGLLMLMVGVAVVGIFGWMSVSIMVDPAATAEVKSRLLDKWDLFTAAVVFFAFGSSIGSRRKDAVQQ